MDRARTIAEQVFFCDVQSFCDERDLLSVFCHIEPGPFDFEANFPLSEIFIHKIMGYEFEEKINIKGYSPRRNQLDIVRFFDEFHLGDVIPDVE